MSFITTTLDRTISPEGILSASCQCFHDKPLPSRTSTLDLNRCIGLKEGELVPRFNNDPHGHTFAWSSKNIWLEGSLLVAHHKKYIDYSTIDLSEFVINRGRVLEFVQPRYGIFFLFSFDLDGVGE